MKRSIVAAAALGSLGVAALALKPRRHDVTDDRVSTLRSVTVRADSGELYWRWRSAAELARFLHGAASVQEAGECRQRWTLDVAGKPLELEMEIVDERPAQRLAWRSGPQGAMALQGSVAFSEAPGGRGTEVRFSLALAGRGSDVVSSFARPFGLSIPQMAMESLRSFKALVEAGETPKAVRN